MHRPPPLRGHPALADRKVLLIDRCQVTREVRAAILRSHGVEAHEAEELSTARFLWQPHVYDLLMLDVRKYSPGEALEFYEQITGADPRQQFAFLTGPPQYLSRSWPSENPRPRPPDKSETQSHKIQDLPAARRRPANLA